MPARTAFLLFVQLAHRVGGSCLRWQDFPHLWLISPPLTVPASQPRWDGLAMTPACPARTAPCVRRRLGALPRATQAQANDARMSKLPPPYTHGMGRQQGDGEMAPGTPATPPLSGPAAWWLACPLPDWLFWDGQGLASASLLGLSVTAMLRWPQRTSAAIDERFHRLACRLNSGQRPACCAGHSFSVSPARLLSYPADGPC